MSDGASTVPSVSFPCCFVRSSRDFVRRRKFSSYRSRSASLMSTPLKRTGLLTKNPSRGYHMYSRSAPHKSMSNGPRSSARSFSSRMYCWTFFQFSSRRVSTCAMKASSSAVGAGLPAVAVCADCAEVGAWPDTGESAKHSATVRRAKRYGVSSRRIYDGASSKGAPEEGPSTAFRAKVGATSYHSGSSFTMRAFPARARSLWTLRKEPSYANHVGPRHFGYDGHSGVRSGNTQHHFGNCEG